MAKTPERGAGGVGRVYTTRPSASTSRSSAVASANKKKPTPKPKPVFTGAGSGIVPSRLTEMLLGPTMNRISGRPSTISRTPQPKDLPAFINAQAGKPYAKAPVTVPRKAEPWKVAVPPLQGTAPKPTSKTASKPTKATGAPRVTSSAAQPAPAKAAPKPPPKSAAQLETERKMREQAQQKALQAQLDRYKNEAGASVNAELGPLLNAIQRQMDEATSRESRSQAEVENRTRIGTTDLNEIFGRLGNFITQTGATTNQQNQQVRAQTGSAYDQLSQGIDQRYGAAQQKSTAELERLGLAGLMPNANQGMKTDQQFLGGLAAVDKQAALTGLDQASTGFNQILGLQRNNAQTEGQVRIGQMKADSAKTLNELQFELDQELNNLQGQKTDIEGTRGQRINELIQAMQERDYNRSREEQQTAFQQNLAERQFGLERTQTEQQLKIQREQADLQRQAAMTPVGPTSQDLLNEANRQRILAELANPKPTAGAKPATGPGPATQRLDQIKDPAARAMWKELFDYAASGKYDANKDGKPDYTLDDPKTASAALAAIQRSLATRGADTPENRAFAAYMIQLWNGTYRG